MASDSERDISVGGIQIAPTSLFTGVDYAALGHLHGRQTLTDVGALQRLARWPTPSPRPARPRAPGSSTSAPTASAPPSSSPAPVPRRLRTAARPHRRPARGPGARRGRGRLAPGHAHRRRAVPSTRWTGCASPVPAHADDRLRARGRRRSGAARSCPRVDGRSDIDVALGFVAEVRDLEATTEEELLLQLACDSCRIDADRDADFTARPPGRGLMRLHRLTVTAFGPFAGTETVDFDELNDAGLFLLTGPTGAGKSSLLDAVCFALYGAGPRGARREDAQVPARRRSSAPPRWCSTSASATAGSSYAARRSGRGPRSAATGCSRRRRPPSITETTGGARPLPAPPAPPRSGCWSPT